MNRGSNDAQPTAPPAKRVPTPETAMLEGASLYLAGSVAAAIMIVLGAISGIVMLAFSGDHRGAVLAAAGVFVLAGIVLTVRLWRMTRASAAPMEPPT